LGIEYRVIFNDKDVVQIDTFLRALPCFADFDKEWKTYNYREKGNTGKMPNAEIRIEDECLYFCDYGMSKHLFGLIITNFVSRFGRVQIEDYEL
jgi:hypothetical protein